MQQKEALQGAVLEAAAQIVLPLFRLGPGHRHPAELSPAGTPGQGEVLSTHQRQHRAMQATDATGKGLATFSHGGLIPRRTEAGCSLLPGAGTLLRCGSGPQLASRPGCEWCCCSGSCSLLDFLPGLRYNYGGESLGLCPVQVQDALPSSPALSASPEPMPGAVRSRSSSGGGQGRLQRWHEAFLWVLGLLLPALFSSAAHVWRCSVRVSGRARRRRPTTDSTSGANCKRGLLQQLERG